MAAEQSTATKLNLNHSSATITTSGTPPIRCTNTNYGSHFEHQEKQGPSAFCESRLDSKLKSLAKEENKFYDKLVQTGQKRHGIGPGLLLVGLGSWTESFLL